MKQLKAKTNQGDDISIYIKQADTGEDKYLIKFDLERIGGWGSYYIDTIAEDSEELSERGLCLYGDPYNYASVSGEVIKKAVNLINDFVKEKNITLET
tara:strand:- start:345 stop:638 length:294 start_codon:yes stop_codon:yes gene_type:complete